MKKSISTDLTAANIAGVLDLLAETPRALDRLCEGLPEEELHSPLGAGERSLLEDLAHLTNSEDRAAEAIRLALLADEPLLAGIHPERELGRLLRLDLFGFSELLAYFKFRRVLLMRVLALLTGEQWARTIREQGKKRRESVYWRARALALHEHEHLLDLEGKLGRSGLLHGSEARSRT